MPNLIKSLGNIKKNSKRCKRSKDFQSPCEFHSSAQKEVGSNRNHPDENQIDWELSGYWNKGRNIKN